jgi:hypothetical protein
VPIKPMPRQLVQTAFRPALPTSPPVLPPAPIRSGRPSAKRRGTLVYWPPVLAAAAASMLLVAGFLWLVAASTPRLPAQERADAAPAPAGPVQESKPAPVVPPVTVAPEIEKKVAKPAPVEPELPKDLVEKKAPATCKPPTALLGTSVEFVDNPATAARTAAREDKLLFILHVSGNFEDPGFT